MGKNVITIPATINRYTAAPLTGTVRRKVAAYARVSTDLEEQQSSYEAQVDYYTAYIQSRDDWDFAGIYADEGITGCNTFKREGFKRMVEDALAGKIDLILTKSVSRFARNTVDTLSTIRTLKEHGTEVYFEKENIWSFDGKGELLLTIMSSLAQEESRSISENCTWGVRKRFADGKVICPFKRFLGYDRGEDGNLVINEEQARVVRRIYGLFLSNMTPVQIANKLTAEGVPTPAGKKKWSDGCVRSILTNEKYKGDALLQKVFTTDFLTKKTKKNEGEVPQYYVTDNHPAIIDPATFDLVQAKMAAHVPGSGKISSASVFCSKIQCGDCGGWYGPKIWHSNDKYRRIVWQCNHKFDGKKCTTPTLTEDEIKTLFLRAANTAVSEYSELISVFESYLSPKFETDALEQELEDTDEEIDVVDGLIAKGIQENARVALDQKAYSEKNAALNERRDRTIGRRKELEAEITRRGVRRQEITRFFQLLRELGPLTEFREEDWRVLVDHMTVYAKDDIWITFIDGSSIKAEADS